MSRTVSFLAATCLLIVCPAAFAHAPDAVLKNSVGMEFVLIPAGSFQMGSGVLDDEKPVHRVEISRAFYLGKHEVTQGQWTQIMGKNPSWFTGENLPVEQVFWDEAQEFIRRLNLKEGRDGYRLPTEAEWEYAARAGLDSDPSGEELGEIAWYAENAGGATHPVGEKKPNALGIYDMLGNVNEWVADWFSSAYYAQSPAKDPAGPDSGTLRVRRGGSWSDEAANCRPARRSFDTPDSSACGAPGCRFGDLGFRVLLTVE
ncbi:MAG: formylglycine-generating enzyme family protein [Desulfovibrio sp.]|jgi:formylglycine-generating enzyme required for sulfatase activity|nr:formylglycine-generating enzyme family protein [Desulfovibrio sp.]